jgi:SAM-dependent methyltransferase
MAREENLHRQTDFKFPSKRSRGYIFYHYFFTDLKNVFDSYIKEGDSVFDIGCGNKPYEKYISKLINTKAGSDVSKYVGCDIVQSSEQKVDIICEATNIPEQSDRYDIVLCTQVIEHVFDHPKVFEEAFRLLKPGGFFIVSSNMLWQLHEEPYDFYRFTRHGFRKLLSNAEFTIKYEKSNGGQWAAFGQMVLHITSINLKNKTVRKLFDMAFLPVTLFCNLFFPWLDRKVGHDSYTLNYLFVGQKS